MNNRIYKTVVYTDSAAIKFEDLWTEKDPARSYYDRCKHGEFYIYVPVEGTTMDCIHHEYKGIEFDYLGGVTIKETV